MDITRKPAVSGSFYPDDKEKLISMLKNFFRNTKEVLKDKGIKALIVPHAGFIYSGQTAAWGYKQLEKEKNKHFVLIGPSHSYPLHGLASSISNSWETPLGDLKQIPAKEESGQIFQDETPHIPEHSLEVQLPFLQYIQSYVIPSEPRLTREVEESYTNQPWAIKRSLHAACPEQRNAPDGASRSRGSRDDKRNPSFSISCFLTGYQLDYQKAADYFLKYYPSSVFIISSDLSHYLPQAIAEKKDKKTIEKILNLNTDYFLSEEDAACGRTSILTLLAMAKKQNWKGKLIYYDTSATASGNLSGVVGYASIAFTSK